MRVIMADVTRRGDVGFTMYVLVSINVREPIPGAALKLIVVCNIFHFDRGMSRTRKPTNNILLDRIFKTECILGNDIDSF